MYQYIWFNKENYNGDINIPSEVPDNWIHEEQIERIGVSDWTEHCLECAVPQCYHNCENWIERKDKKCQKTFYGTKKRDFKGMFLPSQLQFRKWGKIETWIYPGAYSLKRYKYANEINSVSEIVIRGISNCLKWLSPTYKLCGAQVFFREKILYHVGKAYRPEEFLLQCFSPSDKQYQLFVEFYGNSGMFFRDALAITKGYNQARFDVRNMEFFQADQPRIRIYPENNEQEELLLFVSDFVTYKRHEGKNLNQVAPKVKCVAWDLDCTLWDGILIESDPDTLSLRKGVFEVIRQLDKRGIIQIIVSKNDMEPVKQQLQRLGVEDYFVYILANWNAKSSNLKRAAQLLNINIDSFALIDDSKYERQEVLENIGCVRVFDEQDVLNLLEGEEFDVPVTQESQNRRQMYQTEIERKSVQSEFVGTDLDFLKSCKLKARIENISESTMLRSYELVQRTNQLNLSGMKYDKSDFVRLCEQHSENAFVVFCEDRFGSYGQVGFLWVKESDSVLYINEYVMSCRVAGKWLEPALMQWLTHKYHAKMIKFIGKNSKKNGLLIRTLQQFGLKNESINPDELELTIASSQMKWDNIVEIE